MGPGWRTSCHSEHREESTVASMATSTKSGRMLPFVSPDWLNANQFVIKLPPACTLDLPVIPNAPRDEVAAGRDRSELARVAPFLPSASAGDRPAARRQPQLLRYPHRCA